MVLGRETGRHGLGRLVALAPLLAVLTVGCSGSGGVTDRAASGSSSSARPAPRLGGPSFRPAPVPKRPMNGLERPIAARLAGEATGEGLRLDYLDCPRWDRAMPRRLTCVGYFDGVRAQVLVRLRTMAGDAVGFDAEIGAGVIATRNLVERLRDHGYTHVDCGDRAAYRSVAGLRLVCAVVERGTRKYVVATVQNRSGAVAIHAY